MTTITKQLSHNELRAKLDKGGLLRHRPDLALLIMSGQCAYEERRIGQSEGENFALAGSPAAYATKELAPATRAEPSRDMSDEEAERRMEDIRRRHAPSGTAPSPTAQRAQEQPPRDASDDFIKAARAKAANLEAEITGDASEDLLRSVHAGIHNEQRGHRLVDEADADFNPFDFGGAA